MADWALVALEDLVEPERPITYGVVKPGDDPYDGVLFLRGQDVRDGQIIAAGARRITPEVSVQYSRTLLHGGEVVLVLVGTPGESAVVPDSLKGANIARQLALLSVKNSVSPEYVSMYLRSPLGQSALAGLTYGSVQQVINLGDLRRMRIPLPSLTEQRAIAGVLGALDDKIESNRRKIAIAQGLIHTEFLSSTISGARDGSLGDVLTELRSKVSGDTAGVVVFSALAEGRLAVSDDYFTKKVYSAEIDKYLKVPRWAFAYNPSRINIGSIGLNSSMTVGAVSPVYVVAQAQTRAVARWVEQALRTRNLRDKIVAYSSGSVRQVLRYPDFAAIELRLPSDVALSNFEDDTLALYDLVDTATQESHSISVLRDALLPELFSGRLRVKDAELMMENV